MTKTFLKYIALYLPQFHTIPENDEWWGKGFTEWTNVKPAQPLFEGHYQPREPVEELGYYDLSDISVMVKQANMAKDHGIHGFCYYYYWFNGKTLLEKPLQTMLQTPEVDIPFCLCWANHNWTRSWDGGSKKILLEQTYDPTTYTRFIDGLFLYFTDPRYIKINGKALLLIYQAETIKNPKEAVKIWRTYAQEKYGIELFLVCVQQRTLTSPKEYGYDAAVEFAPNLRSEISRVRQEKQPRVNSDDTFVGFYDYEVSALQYVLRKNKDYPLFRF